MPERPENPRVRESVAAEWTAPDSPLTMEDYMSGEQRRDLATPRVEVGRPAPSFELAALDGGTASLEQLTENGPAALVFGSYTCPPFRNSMPRVHDVWKRWNHRLPFLLVYVREAHPQQGWVVAGNYEHGIEVDDPRTDDERRAVAETFVEEYQVEIPVVVDRVDDEVCRQYGGFPNRLAVVSGEGTLAYLTGEGPMEYTPEEWEAAIDAEVEGG